MSTVAAANIVQAEYEWFVCGHSLGGALSLMTPAVIRNQSDDFGFSPKVVTFASMKVRGHDLEYYGDLYDNSKVAIFFTVWPFFF